MSVWLKTKVLIFIILIAGLTSQAVASQRLTIAGSVFGYIARQQGVDPYILYAIAVLESGKTWSDGIVRPWPWTLNVNGRGVYLNSKEEAVEVYFREKKKQKNIDVGICQVSSLYHEDKVTSLIHLMDYTTNIEVAAKILKEALLSSPDDPVLGVGRYHSWKEERAREYGIKAIYLAKTLREKERWLK